MRAVFEEGVSKLLVTTVPGLEDLLLAELRSAAEGSGVTRRGAVIYTLKQPAKGRALARLMSSLALAEKVRAVVAEGRAESLGDVRALLRSSLEQCKELAKHHLFFAVEALREGSHDFTSLDIAREVGSTLQEELQLKVSLDDPDVLFYAEVVREEFRLAIDLTPFISLKDRGYRVYVHPSSLNPIVARAMCRIADLKGGEMLIDPMCGGGTIVIEGLLDRPTARGAGFDANPDHVIGAALNARAAGVVADFGLADARRLPKLFRGGIDVIATNPPYGIRERAVGGLTNLYKALIEGASRVLNESGRMIVLSPLRRMVERLAYEHRWPPVLVKRVDMGGLANFIFLFKKES